MVLLLGFGFVLDWDKCLFKINSPPKNQQKQKKPRAKPSSSSILPRWAASFNTAPSFSGILWHSRLVPTGMRSIQLRIPKPPLPLGILWWLPFEQHPAAFAPFQVGSLIWELQLCSGSPKVPRFGVFPWSVSGSDVKRKSCCLYNKCLSKEPAESCVGLCL